MIENKNQPAFPVSEETTDRIIDEIRIFSGLTKREKIAAMALQGILAKSHTFEKTSKHDLKSMCADAIMFADELLKQLEGE